MLRKKKSRRSVPLKGIPLQEYRAAQNPTFPLYHFCKRITKERQHNASLNKASFLPCKIKNEVFQVEKFNAYQAGQDFERWYQKKLPHQLLLVIADQFLQPLLLSRFFKT